MQTQTLSLQSPLLTLCNPGLNLRNGDGSESEPQDFHESKNEDVCKIISPVLAYSNNTIKGAY